VKGAISTQVEIFDVLGNLVRSLHGTATLSWDGRDFAGSNVVSGVYFVRVTGMDEQGQPFRASKQLVVQR
jgi:flagellar hook assembly protein FlgD